MKIKKISVSDSTRLMLPIFKLLYGINCIVDPKIDFEDMPKKVRQHLFFPSKRYKGMPYSMNIKDDYIEIEV